MELDDEDLVDVELEEEDDESELSDQDELELDLVRGGTPFLVRRFWLNLSLRAWRHNIIATVTITGFIGVVPWLNRVSVAFVVFIALRLALRSLRIFSSLMKRLISDSLANLLLGKMSGKVSKT